MKSEIARNPSIHHLSKPICKPMQNRANPHFQFRRPLLYPVELQVPFIGNVPNTASPG